MAIDEFDHPDHGWKWRPCEIKWIETKIRAEILAEREACAKADDAMIDAYMEFAKKTTYLQHPDVPYHGTNNGDSVESWKRRLVKAALEHAIRARGNK